MTGHELARLLLALPDETVYMSVYNGGDDVYREIKDVTPVNGNQEFVEGYGLELKTYKER